MPLLGLRENQAVTLALINAWAALALDAGECHDLATQFTVESNAYRVIKDIIEGDQDELNDAWVVFQGTTAETGPSKTLSESLSDVDRRLLRCLRADPCFGIVLERLAHNWLLLATDAGEPGEHCIVKFSYDEPLTARYSDAGYTPHEPTPEGGIAPPRYEPGDRRGWRRDLLAGLGLRAALVRFLYLAQSSPAAITSRLRHRREHRLLKRAFSRVYRTYTAIQLIVTQQKTAATTRTATRTAESIRAAAGGVRPTTSWDPATRPLTCTSRMSPTARCPAVRSCCAGARRAGWPRAPHARGWRRLRYGARVTLIWITASPQPC